MELFAVQRYTEEDKTSHDPQKGEEILQKLLKKAKKRKLQQELETQSAPNEAPLVDDKQDPLADVLIKTNDETNQPTNDQIADQPESGDFQVLGSNLFEKKPKVEMILPPWLAHPTVIATAIQEAADSKEDAISELTYLTDDTKVLLQGMPINKLFPVQEAVIPWVLQSHSKPYPFRPRDICVSAPTGSGKTLAFAIPIVQLLSSRVEKRIRALVVLPVAELALQVFKVFKKLAEKTDLSVCLLSTSVPFAGEQQKLVECYKGLFYSKVDIVITTPGRLVEHLHSTKGFCLKSLKFLVIDEADRIMDQVHHNWLYHLDEHVKTTSDTLLSGRAAPLCIRELENSASCQPHKMLFSATLSQDPEKLQNLRLFQPKLFTSVLTSLDEWKEKFAEKDTQEVKGEFIGKYTTPAELTEKYCLTEARLKPLTLYSLITENKWTKFLCFTNSVESSGRLAFVLQTLFGNSFKVAELSASMSPKNRANILSEFTRGKINGLVSSDALARGIDIPDVDIVISYDPARHIKTYIHRIGRTARAGRPGTAITLLDQKELNTFNKTLSEVGKALTLEIKATVNTEADMANNYAKALERLRLKLEHEKHSKSVMKNLAKEKAQPVDPTKMTVMEKLQAEATRTIVLKAAATVANTIEVGKRKIKNPNSSKAFKLKKAQKLGAKDDKKNAKRVKGKGGNK